MVKLSVNEIVEATDGKCDKQGEITSVVTDSRKITDGCLFIALIGEKFDGHNFIEDALKKGAAAVIASHGTYQTSKPIIMVRDTLKALQDLSAYYRDKFHIKTVGVTGSVGKTTTKDMTAAVLSSKFNTLKTQGNFNNEIGLPMTMFCIDPSTEAAVIEMGMSDLGEISLLSKIAKPDIAVITNIGISHIENLKTRENILKAKLEMIDGMKNGSTLFLNADNDLLSTVKLSDYRVVFYGIENEKADIKAKNITADSTITEFDIVYGEKVVRAKIPALGSHNVLNAIAAFGIGLECGIDEATAIAALMNYKPSGMRQNIVVHDGITVIEDCYNASPDSMKAALNTLSNINNKGRKFAVLADMLELGEFSQKSHFDVGKLAGELKLDGVFCFGEMSKFIVQGAKQCGIKSRMFEDKNSLSEDLLAELKCGDAVLFKGSRAMMLEDVIKDIYTKEKD